MPRDTRPLPATQKTQTHVAFKTSWSEKLCECKMHECEAVSCV